MDDKATIDLELQKIKKYWKCMIQVADELSYLLNFLIAFAVFVKKAWGN